MTLNADERLETLCRKAAVEIAGGKKELLTVTADQLRDYLDDKPNMHEHILEKKKPGIVTGLAWTQVGGEIRFVETMMTKGSGKITIANHNALGRRANVNLASNSSLEIASGVTNTVRTLTVGGVQQPDGYYTFGSGTLRVFKPATRLIIR